VYKSESEFRLELKRIIDDQGFKIKVEKTRLQKSNYRQLVTGLVVNVKPNQRKDVIKKVRMYLYYWERYGERAAETIYKFDYLADRIYGSKDPCRLRDHLKGHIEFIKMIRGKDDETVKKLETRLQKLANWYYVYKIDEEHIMEIVVKEGIEKAMQVRNKMKKLVQ
jgi:hypothetical protein